MKPNTALVVYMLRARFERRNFMKGGMVVIGKNRSKDATHTWLNKDAWLESAMDNYGDAITKLAYHYVRDWGRAEDIAQDVFISAYQNIDYFKGKSSEKTWIYRIAVNRCKDILKSSGFRRTILSRFDFLQTKSTETPELTVVQRDTSHVLIKCLFELPAKYREVILLFYYDELSLLEVSEILGIKIDTVKTRLRRARGRLKIALGEEGYDGQ
jgi:RNA polymerase sigma factor (sigma-70 family)